MKRLFVALPLPVELGEQVARAAACLSGRKVAAEQYHITLAFLGEGDPAAAGEALRRVDFSAFTGSLGHPGTFSSGKDKVLWLGVEPAHKLTDLACRVQAAMTRAGFALPDRPFAPHLTLARRFPGGDLSCLAPLAGRPFPCREILLCSSRLTPQGPVYRVEGRKKGDDEGPWGR